MKSNVKLIKTQRQFSQEFKKSLVKEFEQGKLSILQLSRLHGVANQQLYNWVYKYSIFNKKGARIIEMEKSSTKKVKELEKRLKELEQIVGRKQIKIDYLETLIEVANDELNVDIKKNSDIPQSKSSETKKIK